MLGHSKMYTLWWSSLFFEREPVVFVELGVNKLPELIDGAKSLSLMNATFISSATLKIKTITKTNITTKCIVY